MKITEELSEEVCEIYKYFICIHHQLINNVRRVDEYLFMHGTNVGIINGLMGKWLNLSKEDMARLVKVGLLHDVGKQKSTQIINKHRKLTSGV